MATDWDAGAGGGLRKGGAGKTVKYAKQRKRREDISEFFRRFSG